MTQKRICLHPVQMPAYKTCRGIDPVLAYKTCRGIDPVLAYKTRGHNDTRHRSGTHARLQNPWSQGTDPVPLPAWLVCSKVVDTLSQSGTYARLQNPLPQVQIRNKCPLTKPVATRYKSGTLTCPFTKPICSHRYRPGTHARL